MENNKIYQGDSLELLRKLPDNSIDLVITSPPYSSMKSYVDFNGIPADEYVDWFIPYCIEVCRVIKPSGSFILNINDKVESGFRHPYVFDLISRLHKETELKMFERLFWNKKKSLPNRSRFGDRIEYMFWFVKDKNFYFNIDEMRTEYSETSVKRMTKPLKKRFSRNESNQDSNRTEQPDDYKDWAPNVKGALPTTLINISSETKRIANNHVAVYPTELVKYFIKGSTKPGDVVLDIFMGTGTTAMASIETERNYIGFEIQPSYIDLAGKRLSNYKNILKLNKCLNDEDMPKLMKKIGLISNKFINTLNTNDITIDNIGRTDNSVIFEFGNYLVEIFNDSDVVFLIRDISSAHDLNVTNFEEFVINEIKKDS